MNNIKLPLWLQHIVATLGGGGIFLLAFLDSSVLSFPVVTDLLIMEESIRNPSRMPYYAAMAALGSLSGCIWLYLIAKKGGEAMFHHHAGHRAMRIRNWVEENGFLSVVVPSILPPPIPFKIFVLASGVFQVRFRTFVLALLIGRGSRYLIEGILAVRYGEAAANFLLHHKVAFLLVTLGASVLLYIVTSWVFRRQTPENAKS
jgi:membrane protein YqaA with SNARE-associated domain